MLLKRPAFQYGSQVLWARCYFCLRAKAHYPHTMGALSKENTQTTRSQTFVLCSCVHKFKNPPTHTHFPLKSQSFSGLRRINYTLLRNASEEWHMRTIGRLIMWNSLYGTVAQHNSDPCHSTHRPYFFTCSPQPLLQLSSMSPPRGGRTWRGSRCAPPSMWTAACRSRSAPTSKFFASSLISPLFKPSLIIGPSPSLILFLSGIQH